MDYKIDLSKEDPKNIFIAVSDPYYSINGDEAAICIVRKKDDITEVLHTAVARYKGRPDYYKELMEISKFYECHTIIKETDEREVPRKYSRMQELKDRNPLTPEDFEEGRKLILDSLSEDKRYKIPFPSLLDEWLNLKAPDRFSTSIELGINSKQIVFNNNYFRQGDKITSNLRDYYQVMDIRMFSSDNVQGYLYTFDRNIPQDKHIRYTQ